MSSLIDKTQYEMMKMIRVVGMVNEKSSPFCTRLETMHDLFRVLATYAPKTVVSASPIYVIPFPNSTAPSD